jgi:hypothetical protein
MTTNIGIHNAFRLHALSNRVSGSLTIEIDSDDRLCPDSIVMFTQDQVLSDRLGEAINQVVEARRVERAEQDAVIEAAIEGAA